MIRIDVFSPPVVLIRHFSPPTKPTLVTGSLIFADALLLPDLRQSFFANVFGAETVSVRIRKPRFHSFLII